MVSAGLAHEIRNPLVAIRTFAELLPHRMDDVEFRSSFLEVATGEVHRLEELVSQFMTLARPSAAVRETLDVPRLVDKCVTAVSAHAQAQQVTIGVAIAPDLPELRGDDARLYQALMNLLLNAVDATPAGGRVELRAAPGDRDGRSPGVSLTVWNSGSYIPPEVRERVFEPFYTSKASGTGLGLAICHTIVDEHGGTTTVESDETDGTAFVVHLPVTSYHELAASQTA
jgi:signal transduction histidine kinase